MIYLTLLILEIIILYFLSRRVVKRIYHFFYRVTKRKNWTGYLFAFVFLPGTFIHEISHFLAALFLLVPVGKLELLPKIEEEGSFKLGSVAIAKTDPLRRFFIGIAPLFFGLSIIFTVSYLLTNKIIDAWWGYLLAGYIVFQVANSMFASKKDLEGAVIVFILLAAVVLIAILLGINIPLNLTNLTFSPEVSETLKRASLFLLFPIVVDFLFLLLLKKR